MPGTQAAGHRLYIDSWGTGSPLVFIHGLGASARYWEPLKGALPYGYHGIAQTCLDSAAPLSRPTPSTTWTVTSPRSNPTFRPDH